VTFFLGIAASVVAFPLMYRTVRSAFEQIDQNIINAARTLGVSEWKIFWKITIPLSWPGVAAGTVLAFARALGDFGATLMIGGKIPGKTLTIPAAIFFPSFVLKIRCWNCITTMIFPNTFRP